MRPIQIKPGDKFDRWTIVEEVASRRIARRPRRHFRCRCECGREKAVSIDSLRQSSSRSCGCIRKLTNSRHGMHGSREYSIWAQMLYRCSPTPTPQRGWRNYGGRGISVCKEWRASFQAFYGDMGPSPSPKHTLDRIDNDGNYEPGNVRWATYQQQRANKRRTYWERVVTLIAAQAGISFDDLQKASKEMTCAELARHIAASWYPRAA